MMMRLFLDILPYPKDQYIPEAIHPVNKPVTPVVDSAAQLPPAVADSAAVPQQVADSAAATQDAIMNVGAGSGDGSVLLWTVLCVAAALAVCAYFAYAYRRSLMASAR
ncbi:MAG: hypothetical protein IJ144_03320 [Prevotella sp.]|nr:hypothetical protein [Prevotella sp.]